MHEQTIKNELEVKNPYAGREGLVYVRVSSKRQETDGTGLQSQETRCVKELNSLGITYKKSFRDSFTGGGDFMKRPAMRNLLNYIDANKFKKFVVVFDDLKRFARDTEFHLKLRAAFKVRDVLLKCLNYNFDESPEGRFAEIVMAAQGELERLQNKRQVIDKMKARLESGFWAFARKRGYKMIKDSMHGKLATPDKKESLLIKKALEGFSTGEFVRRLDVCKYLVEEGFWKGRPEKYTDELTEMIKDVFYIGDIEYPEWEVSRRKGHHEALISPEIFELNQKRLQCEISGRKIRQDMSEDFPMRGLIVCAECGKHLTACWTRKSHGNKRLFPYYLCQNRKCAMYRRCLKRDEIDRKFKTLLEKQKMKRNVSALVKVVFDRIWKQEISSMVDKNLALEHKETLLKEKSKKLTDMIINSADDELVQVYQDQLKETKKDIEDLNSQTMMKTDYSIPYQTALGKATGLLNKPYSIWKRLPLIEQQRLFYFIFMEKLPYDKNVGYQTDKIPSAVKLFEEFVTAKPDSVDSSGIGPEPRQCECRVMPLYYEPNGACTAKLRRSKVVRLAGFEAYSFSTGFSFFRLQ